MSLSSIDRRHAAWAFIAYLAFVVYGSLIPFEYRAHTLAEAIESFSNIRYLNLGVVSRADWVANIVLYVPLAFLGCVWLLGMRMVGTVKYLALLPIFLICLAIAVGVEFTQTFFAPRTVSINDLVAESLGSLAGILLWALGRWRVVQLWDAFLQGGRQSVLAVIAAYGLGYVAMSLFPFDFVISAEEFAWKLKSGNLGWLIAAGCDNWIRCGARLAGDAIAIAPLGLLLLVVVPQASPRQFFTGGLVLGIALEIVQLFLGSGTSQGLSVVMRGLGLLGGAVTGRLLLRSGPVPLARIVLRAVPFVALPYLLLLAAVNGWFSASWLPLGEGLARLADVRLMPLYYHYFSTEPEAMASLIAIAIMYGPLGVVIWAREAAGVRIPGRGALAAAFWAACLALPMELGKLMVPPKHPDFTDLLIAAASAACTFSLIRWIEQALTGSPPHSTARTTTPAISVAAEPVAAGTVKPETSEPVSDWPIPRPAALLLGLPALLAVLVGLVSYPVGGAVLAALLLLYGGMLWRRPLLWFFVIPALLPLLDLSQITGRLLLDEFDLLVLVTLAVGYPRVSGIKPRSWPNALLPAALVLLWVTWGLAITRGLWPLVGNEGDITAGSHSPVEAWVVGKGMLWSLLLVPIIRRLPHNARKPARNYFFDGLVAGLGLLTLAVLWERHVFVGLGDMENVFRVTGTFASMHTGGAYIEAFIAFAFPVLAVWVLTQKSWKRKALGIGLAVLTSYAMLVTFSRGGYAGLAAGLMVVIFGTLRMRSARPGPRWIALVGLTVAVLAVAVPILSGGFAQQRLGRTAEDFAFRQSHWARALDLMDDGVLAAVAGMGFGRYPSVYLWNDVGPKSPGTYQIMREDDDPFLRLGSGESVFLEQMVNVKPGTNFRVSARLRQAQEDAGLSAPLCEKALLYSFECVWNQLKPDALVSGWQVVSVDEASGRVGASGRWPHGSVKLSLYNPGKSVIDVDDVSLVVSEDREMVVNGDFSDGVERWLFVTDQDLAWHIHEQWVEIYFAQGLLGVVAILILLAGVTRVLGPEVLAGHVWATGFAAALAGFLTVGLLGSTMDTARLMMLFYTGALCAGLLFRSRGLRTGRS